ncbi:2,3-diphosphoglycerate-dependent phosphoglycerate mutase [Buchnera aphidicola (Mindarus keteleerifoliae)]|uniref:2,3-diphosphoglycerate-dependent phosphoglycerate mutase n=1 Tax=Buchnera aphidicola TaxID=9 RepID=UPI0031B6FA03
MKVTKMVLLRHGESKWNKLNRFTGWHDIDLSKKGVLEAKNAGKLLKSKNFFFDYSYTSLLKRAIHTTWNILIELNQSWIPVKKTWRLNERHYGLLQGADKSETELKYGKEIVSKWRRGFKIAPPELKKIDQNYSGYDRKYEKLNNFKKPMSESLEMTKHRVIPIWEKSIFPKIKNNNTILIVAHGNSLRALMKHLSNIKDDQIKNLDIPTGTPIVYEFDEKSMPIKYYFLEK